MAQRRPQREYIEGPEAAWRFDKAMTHVIGVSKEDLDRREAEYREANKHKPRRGPKPASAKT